MIIISYNLYLKYFKKMLNINNLQQYFNQLHDDK